MVLQETSYQKQETRIMSYKKLEIWQLAREVSIEVDAMTKTKLPPHEMYESGRQIRRSAKSVRSNIVEGYGRKKYPNEYIRFLIIALASNDETIDHLETLYECKSLTDKELTRELHSKMTILGKKLNKFIQSIERNK